MKISLKRTGGFAGIPFHKTINTDSLPPKRQQEIQQTIEETNFFGLSSQTNPGMSRDQFQYTIRVEHEEQSHTVSFTENNLPKPLHSLISWVTKQ